MRGAFISQLQEAAASNSGRPSSFFCHEPIFHSLGTQLELMLGQTRHDNHHNKMGKSWITFLRKEEEVGGGRKESVALIHHPLIYCTFTAQQAPNYGRRPRKKLLNALQALDGDKSWHLKKTEREMVVKPTSSPPNLYFTSEYFLSRKCVGQSEMMDVTRDLFDWLSERKEKTGGRGAGKRTDRTNPSQQIRHWFVFDTRKGGGKKILR
jgi:hypothetical protein